MAARPPKERPEVYVLRMFEHANELASLVETGKITPEKLGTDPLVQLATVKALELVGEQAWQLRRLDYDLGPDIDLAEIAGMRHRMVHHYEGIDWGVVYEATFEDVPALVRSLERILRERHLN